MLRSSNRYYQDELAYLRDMGREFARAYPALAPLLAEKSGDPDVERLLQGVAFLTSRVRQKLDDELPQVIQGIAELLFPDFLRPMPSAAILELTPLPNVVRGRVVVPAGSEFGSRDVDGVRCVFRSSLDCELLPWVLEAASLHAAGASTELRLTLRVPSGIPLAQIGATRARFHLAGDARASLGLLMWLTEQIEDVALVLADGQRTIALGKHALTLVGFGEHEGLLPATPTTAPGPRLLAEYFTLPAKFAFVDVVGIDRVRELDPKASELTIALRLRAPPPEGVRVTRDAFRLHCVPIVNLFATTAEPIAPDVARSEHVVRPAGRAPSEAEVHTIRDVVGFVGATGERFPIAPLVSFAHGGEEGGRPFYWTHVRPSVVGDGVDTTISFGAARHGGGHAVVEADAISIDLLATNRALPGSLRAGEVCVPVATSPAVATFRNLSAPTPYVAPPFGLDLQWRVVAGAAMGLASITDVDVLRTALDVYDLKARVDAQAARASELRRAALEQLTVRRAEQLYKGCLVRGLAIDLRVADAGFASMGDLHLFGAVLERFFASYVSINSFTRTTLLAASSRMSFSWPARSGSLTLT